MDGKKNLVEVRTDDNGPYQFVYRAWVNESDSVVLTQAREGVDGLIGMVGVPVAYRGQVALAILGGITDELVERVSDSLFALFDDYRGRGHYTEADARAEALGHARGMIELLFGLPVSHDEDES